MAKSKIELLKEEKEFLHSVSAAGFISYVAYILTRITVVFVVQGFLVSKGGLIWFYAEAILVALGILFGVRKASMTNLVKSVRIALADGKITRDEAWAILREMWFLLLGNWSDIIPESSTSPEAKKILDTLEVGEEIKPL